MRFFLGTSLIAAFSLIGLLAAAAQTRGATPSPSLKLPQAATLPQGKYEYRFISQHNIWSNRPLNETAGKICNVMKSDEFAESAYAVRGQDNWNSCVYTQIQSIGYMRWLQNDGFKATRKNRKLAKAFLAKTYTMGRWGSYSLAELRAAVRGASGQ